MVGCYVIADEKTASVLSDFIKIHPLASMKGYMTDFESDLSLLKKYPPDIIFIDDSLQGFTFQKVNFLKETSLIVIISEEDQVASIIFEEDIFDYVVKPYQFESFSKTLDRYQSVFKYRKPVVSVQETFDEFFFIKTEKKGVKEMLIRCSDLTYIEAKQNYVVMYLEDGQSFLCYNNLKEIESSLSPQQFSRIHKSYIINDSKILFIEGNMIFMRTANKVSLQIGAAYKKAFIEKKDSRLIKSSRKMSSILNHVTEQLSNQNKEQIEV